MARGQSMHILQDADMEQMQGELKKLEDRSVEQKLFQQNWAPCV